ncbi:DNA repair protein RecO [Swaminathania salitolerans]|uniref:DNA repair protein RecO n=1 Tax=Swaminathania salitolerans TaxID=182838 RepID=A0A511BQN0_9PROT|nr:DNA repair protein RecO [Swaminathania salitolerans]GBQ10739.1 DNA repair protein RecO [Swaminathania salitolerans LMG 21291]GEL02153.1 DNA repair protein RecO [Swaminathania salitolerans]
MNFECAAIVLSARRYGEGGAIAHLFTEEYGRIAGLVRGGSSRRQSALWQPGNIVLARHAARLPDQLGHLSGEPVQETAVRVLDRPLQLALVHAATELADAALPDREAHPDFFLRTIRDLTSFCVLVDPPPVGEYIRWEAALLSALGYGLSLSSCAVTGETGDLRFVSPRTGRAVSLSGAGDWKDRLLPLPAFLARDDESLLSEATPEDWLHGLDLTGHFLSRDLFGVRHRPVPDARARLRSRIAGLIHPPE